MPGGEVFIEAAKGFLQDQLLYGSAYPVRELDVCLELFLALKLPAGVYDKTLGRNAARVFGLSIGT
jgi:predicted TIM-barrel fold metal-dependent hydrolase